ncbi:MAG: ATP-binding protein [Flammeovirgaceae bacterium]|nr:ATP-binding protein [Flammeovirgaceae bacterium]
MLKIVVIGPECTGKTDLSQYLASYFKTEWVSEYARMYLDKLIHPYNETDLVKIAHGQARMEDEWVRDADRLLICDTNPTVVKIWCEFKYGKCEPEILDTVEQRKYDLYLLTYIDVPWENDPQREHPTRREELWKIYLNELTSYNYPFVEIKGSRDERRKKAVEAVQALLDRE